MKKRKIISILLILIIIFSNFQNIALAKMIGGAKNLTSLGACRRNIEFKFSVGWSVVKGDYIAYVEDGKQYAAYCIMPGIDGVDELGDYTVDITKVLEDEKLYRVIVNGFPYKTAEELGVENDYDAYMATKQAIKCILVDRDVRSNYRGKDEAGKKVVDLMERLVDIGRNGTQRYQEADLKISKNGTLQEEGNYYTQLFSVSSSVDISNYDIVATANMPSGAFIANISNQEKTSFAGNENFKLVIPKSSMTNDFDVAINIMGKCRTYPVLYGKTRIADSQDYAVATDPYGDYSNIITASYKLNTGSIKVNKTDSETGRAVEGVTFQLSNSNGEVVGTAKTNANGVATFSNLYQGNYKLTEIATNGNYILNTDTFDVFVEYNKTTTKNITNDHKKGNIRINKTDSETSQAIEGVTFELQKEDGTVLGTSTTNNKGEAYFNNIRIGKYKLKEISTNNNYVLNSSSFDVIVEHNKTTTKNITNDYKKGNIKINKIDSETSQAIEGVTFELQKEDGTIVGTSTTNNKGEAYFNNIRIGKYKLKEVSTNNNYILNTNTFEVFVEYSKTTTQNITNDYKKGNIKINKIDSETSQTIEGVTFELQKEDGTVVGNSTTNNKGEAYFNNIRIGKYKLKEVSTNSNYILNSSTFDVVVEHNRTTTQNITNDHKKGNIKINKTDSETSQAIEGVTFELQKEDGTVLGTSTTNNKGEAYFNNIRIGKYKLKEVSTNSNYILNSSTFDVIVEHNKTTTQNITNEHKRGNLLIRKVDKDNNNITLGNVEFQLFSEEFQKVIGTYNTDVNGEIVINNIRIGNYRLIETKSGKWYNLTDDVNVIIKWNETADSMIENELKKGSVKIIKVDSEDNRIRIPNTKFEILDEDNNVLEEVVTDSNGEAITKEYPIRDYKNIKIHEVESNEWYVLNDEIEVVKLKENDRVNITFENIKKKGQVRVIKVDLEDNEIRIPGVEFNVIDEAGKVVDTLITDRNGEAISKKLPIYQVYTLKETKTHKDYILNEETKEITLTYNQVTDIVFENERKKGQIEICKVDSQNNEMKLEGVEFQIINYRDEVVETIITNSEGHALTSKISIGEYKIKEISLGTNEEYILNDDIKTIKVEADKIKSIQIENEHKKGSLIIHKVDLDNNTIPVSDVEFEVTDKDGYKYKAISDENGIAHIENIRIGIVSIKEIATNKIYKISEETYEAEIKWNESTEITITNEKLKGQIEVFKVDAEDNKIKLEGVEFQVINSNNEVIETIVTNSDGYAITSRIPIGEYSLKEIKTDEMHILNKEIFEVKVLTDSISRLDITNERIKGKIKIVKTSQDDNFINGKEAGSPIANVKFKIYDVNNNVVDEITTSKEGIAISKSLDKGCYSIKEEMSGEWYLLNNNIFDAEIKEHEEIVKISITNESEKPSVDIEKEGLIQTSASQEIKYDFKLKNTGNVPLDKFTWYDCLPTDYVRISKLITGTYNQDLNYSIYYKTNKHDFKLLKDNLNTLVNNYIDFSNLELETDEYVTEFKVDFGTVDVGFESVINPYIFVRVKTDVQNDDIFTNKTRIEGYNKTYLVFDEDEHTTKIYEKEVEVKKLPRTGM